MDKTNSEVFGYFIYDETLTYDELLQLEESLIDSIESLFERAEALNIDFTPMGDALMLQCNFVGHKVYIFRKIACELAEMLPSKLSGRLVCLSHSLNICHIYWLHEKKWEEQSLSIPKTPPQGLKNWISHQREQG